MGIAVIPTTANAIRAQRAANPKLSARQLAAKLGVHHHLVDLALQKGAKRRPKSRAS